MTNDRSEDIPKHIQQELLKNSQVQGDLTIRDITQIGTQFLICPSSVTPMTGKFGLFNPTKITLNIPCYADFVGREQVIEDLIAATSTTRTIAILGIPGIGKTALMAQIASRFEQSRVFWYEFRAELASLDDTLMRLASFLDSQPEAEGNLSATVQTHRLYRSSLIDLIIEKLNQADYYIFFDSVHHIIKDSDLGSFFSILKNNLQRGFFFVAGRYKPDFYTLIDEGKKIVKTVQLDGLDEHDIQNFFKKRGIPIEPEFAELIASRLDGLPIAIELIVNLLRESFSEKDIQALIEQAEEQVIDHLFQTVYNQINSDERDLLTIASFFILPFSQDNLIGAYKAILEKKNSHTKVSFTKLQQQFLIEPFKSNFYKVHEVIRRLAINYVDEPNNYQIKLADYLVIHAPDDGFKQLEAVLLYYDAEEFNRAAELVVSLIDMGLLPYHPDWAEGLLGKFEEEMISPENWVWLIGSKGNLAFFWRQYEEAEDCYRRMLKIAEKLQDKVAAAIALQRMGIVYHDRNYQIAETNYLNSLALKKELNDLEGQAQIYSQLGMLYTTQHRLDEAYIELDKGLKLLETIDAPDWQKQPLYGNLGILYAEQGEWEKAVRFTEIGCQIAEEMSMPDERAMSIYNLGLHAAGQGNQEAARDYYLKALEIAKIYGLWHIEELAQLALGKYQYELGEYDEAIACFQKVLEIQEKFKDRAKLAVTYFDIGSFYSLKFDYTTALYYYQKGSDLFEYLNTEEQVRNFLSNIYVLAKEVSVSQSILHSLKLLKKRLLANSPSYVLAKIYETLGKIYFEILHKDRAGLACLRQEINLLAQLERKQEQVEALVSFALIYEERENYEQALDTNTEGINIAEASNLYNLAGGLYYNRANCFTNLEMWQQAEEDYRRCLALAEQANDTALQESALHNLGEMYRRWNRPGDAIKSLESSLESSIERDDIESQIITLNNLGLAYEQLSQAQKALECFNEALSLSCQYYRKCDESIVLISLGNFYLVDEQPDKAKDYYENALVAARLAEDTNLEEDSILSLAYAHRQLGTFDKIAEDFKAVAERTFELKHYKNFVKFLTFGGKINLEKGEAQGSAEMFEQALWIAFFIVVERFSQCGTRVKPSFLAYELRQVIGQICDNIKETVEKGAVELAKGMYNTLLSKLQNPERWSEGESWIIDSLKPIEDYFTKQVE
ncbi:tetratricopeptide repeat protein [Planktothrix sp. FACHB-1355]|uniref:Tetratricopeptide repeat protein n=1 Tax=Aerosakkonema funiforme FACHB-1375 TaxID=2949571 RepID=A0A926VAL7_9CYAN|nr:MULTISPECIES: tetratricopeptide repeat protein [Oscillatoriales]MBD2180313.1 tetratricopeptide repeat protein [Aerosakkonema funiforme FACHB-1375]MBD3557408.1 tetratricopeptide repeat protein [Planktothrix sp. FACHB-1355]